jgi:hypothetical protein
MDYETAVKLTMCKLIEGGYLPCEALYLTVTRMPSLAATAVMSGVRRSWLQRHNATTPLACINMLAKLWDMSSQ